MKRYRSLWIVLSLLILVVILAACSTSNTSQSTESQVSQNPVQEASSPQLPTKIVVYKSPTCGCCGEWTKHMEENGFDVEVKDVSDLASVKTRFNVPNNLQSCHTALIGDYVIEGHVPAIEVQRLLQQHPENVVGLAVPGMPSGAPGMNYGSPSQPYEVIAFDDGGGTEVFASYGP